jgi:hypothetical protein
MNYLLFAPDHSKDELATDRDLIFHQKKKLKVCKLEIDFQQFFFSTMEHVLRDLTPPPTDPCFERPDPNPIHPPPALSIHLPIFRD